jgi:hypothetical protein
MSMILDGTNGATFNDGSLQGAAASPYVLKNRIINGAMVIDQRNAGASVTPTDAQYSLDRWKSGLTQTSKFSIQQNAGSVTPPAGFSNYLGITSLSAYSVISTDEFEIYQNIEGFNTADLDFGKATAKTVTLSFWVRSSLTGTFGGSLFNAALNRSYVFSYTISSANTWEQKSITIAGDTSGTWVGSTNGAGISVLFSIGAGSSRTATAGAWNNAFNVAPTGQTSVVGTNGATWYVTGVQLEIGSSATPFERRLYGTELNLCYRYCWNLSAVGGNDNYTRFGVGGAEGTGSAEITILPPQTFRGSPSLTTTGTASQYAGYSGGSIIAASTITMAGAFNPQSLLINIGASGAFTAGREVTLMANNNKTAYLLFTAEL